MSRILISNRVQRDFAMVPNAIWRSKLPFAAKGVAAYLFSLRDGSVPYVAEMEAALGLGRDARRKAFAILEAACFLEWRVGRNSGGAIVTKTLVLNGDLFDLAEAQNALPPESQAHGETAVNGGDLNHAPENPAGGFSASVGVEIHLCRGGKSGDTLKEDKIKKARDRAAAARSVASRRVVPDGAVLTAFQRSRILSGQSVLVDGVNIAAGSGEMLALAQALRSQSAVNKVGVA